jgi:hypothetical protein
MDRKRYKSFWPHETSITIVLPRTYNVLACAVYRTEAPMRSRSAHLSCPAQSVQRLIEPWVPRDVISGGCWGVTLTTRPASISYRDQEVVELCRHSL